MAETSSTSAAAPPSDGDGLELDRWGTRFVRIEAEAAYVPWAHRVTLPQRRAAVAISLLGWATLAITMAVAGPPGLSRWAPAFALMAAILAWVGWTARGDSPRYAMAAALSANAASGLLGAGVCNLHLHQHAAGLALVALTCMFQQSINRDGPFVVALSTLPSLVVEETFVVAQSRAASAGVPSLVFETLILVSALWLGLIVAVVGERSQRVSYRQERIIEAQKATIARQQELLKQELSHQVAERSRELGVVLAKSNLTLDARKLSAGERFAERYRVVAPLGAGGMGAVYEVERVTDSQRLALKAVVGEVSGASAARFAREAEIGARIHHANLVSIVDVGVSSGVPFLVMELVRGGSLEAKRDNFGDVPWALPILRQIAEGLAALHDAGVVHRDLKPANVLLAEGAPTGGPRAKISDFGISRFGAIDDATSIDPSAATIGASPSPKAGLVTGTGVIMGTPLYMAPEAARGGRALEASADVFALGIIAYEMLTGRAPFSVPAVVLAMAEQPTPTPAAIDDPCVPAALRALVLDCLAGDPAKRPRLRPFLAALG